MNSRAAERLVETACPNPGPPDALAPLQTLARTLPEPDSYFAGVLGQNAVLPDNVLLFHRRRPMTDATPASHHRFVLILNLRTEGSVAIDHTHFRLCPGQAILVFPYQFHWYANFRDRSISWLFVTFEPDRPEALRRLKNVPVPLSAAARGYAESLCRLFLANRRNGMGPDNRVASTCALLLEELRLTEEAFAPAARLRADDAAAGLAQRIGRVLDDRLDEPLRIADIARALGISAGHLRNTFRERLGVSLGRYLRELRLHKALRLLGTTNLTISQIADRCGYDSLFSFSRTFKRKMKMAPRVYRRRLDAAR